jgi:hypothetical protein
MVSLAAPRLALAAPVPLNVVAAKGQLYYASSAFLAKVGPAYAVDITDASTSSEALDSLLPGGMDVAYIGLITAVLAAAAAGPSWPLRPPVGTCGASCCPPPCPPF